MYKQCTILELSLSSQWLSYGWQTWSRVWSYVTETVTIKINLNKLHCIFHVSIYILSTINKWNINICEPSLSWRSWRRIKSCVFIENAMLYSLLTKELECILNTFIFEKMPEIVFWILKYVTVPYMSIDEVIIFWFLRIVIIITE